jgi:hypothetical protein
MRGKRGEIFFLHSEQFMNEPHTLKPALTISGLKKLAEKAVPAADA